MSFDVSKRLINLQGKDYLEVKYRIVWMREEHPDWTITTEMIMADNTQAMFKASILDAAGRLISTAHGTETPKDFKDYIEKAETKAIGRALAFAGYGTQFAPDLEEGNRIVDSPVARLTKPNGPPATKLEVVDLAAKPAGKELEDALNFVPFRNGLDAGKSMRDVPTSKLEWLVNSERTSLSTKTKARLVLLSRKGISDADPHGTPMPTDADAPDEPLAVEEPPF